MTQPEISVIIPVYNTAPFLGRCVDSVLEQTFTGYELILVDDGSTDGSGALCDGYAAGHGNVRAYHQENQGLALTRRNGLRHAAGRYVTFLDSDDWLEKDALELMHRAAASSGADFVSAQYKKVDENGRVVLDTALKEDVVCRSGEDAAREEYRTRRISTAAWAKLIRRGLMDGVSFPGGLAIGEEHDMVAQIVSASRTAVVLKDSVYCYYQRAGSISRSGYDGRYRNSLLNYMRLSDSASAAFPGLERHVRALYLEYEMGCVTAMCRNRNYDWDVVRTLRGVIRRDFPSLLLSGGTRPVFKAGAFLILLCPRLFLLLYRAFYRLQSAVMGGAQQGYARTAAPCRHRADSFQTK